MSPCLRIGNEIVHESLTKTPSTLKLLMAWRRRWKLSRRMQKKFEKKNAYYTTNEIQLAVDAKERY